MTVNIVEVGVSGLPQYAWVSIAFEVESILQVEPVESGLGGVLLREQKLEQPYRKDYDGEGIDTPLDWPRMFDLRNWGIFLAWEEARLAGAAAVAFDTPEVNMLEGRKDLSVLWDIRVQPEFRGCGVGTQLFRTAAEWSRQRGCKYMKIETQNVNVPACRFYAHMGSMLGVLHRFGYYGHPKVGHEAMLIWYLEL